MAIMALHAAASGMQALNTKLDVLANNLANVNTAGFKRSRVNFEDLLYQIKREPGIRNVEDEPIPHGIQVGLGVQVSGTQLDFREGAFDPTDNPLDVRINGELTLSTPVWNRPIEAGTYTIEYYAADGSARTREVQLSAGDGKRVVLE